MAKESADSHTGQETEVSAPRVLTQDLHRTSQTRKFKLTVSPTLTKVQTETFLIKERVVVYKVLLHESTQAGIQVYFKEFRSMCRLEFYVFYVVWFAINILGLDAEFDFESRFVKFPSTLVDSALNKLDNCDVGVVLTKLKQYLFEHEHVEDEILTYYAKDGEVCASEAATNMLAMFAKQCTHIRAIVKQDVIQHMGLYDGMALQKAWLYSGGTCLAGHHVEDGFLRFVHVSVHIDWDDSFFECKECM